MELDNAPANVSQCLAADGTTAASAQQAAEVAAHAAADAAATKELRDARSAAADAASAAAVAAEYARELERRNAALQAQLLAQATATTPPPPPPKPTPAPVQPTPEREWVEEDLGWAIHPLFREVTPPPTLTETMAPAPLFGEDRCPWWHAPDPLPCDRSMLGGDRRPISPRIWTGGEASPDSREERLERLMDFTRRFVVPEIVDRSPSASADEMEWVEEQSPSLEDVLNFYYPQVIQFDVPIESWRRDEWAHYVDEEGWVPIRFPSETPNSLRGSILATERWIAHWRYVRGYWMEKARTHPFMVELQGLSGVRVEHHTWRSFRQDMYLLVWEEDLPLMNGWPEPQVE